VRRALEAAGEWDPNGVDTNSAPSQRRRTILSKSKIIAGASILLIGVAYALIALTRDKENSKFDLHAPLQSGSISSPYGDLSMRKINTIAASAAVAFSAISFAPTAPQAQAQNCTGDNNGDGFVNGVDLAQVLVDWGECANAGLSISSVSPSFGSAAGGTAITIAGKNFTGATSVMIGGITATSFVVVSATTITAVSPIGSAGAKDVVVTTPAGTATLVGGFVLIAGSCPSPTWATVLEWIPNPAVVTDANLRAAITATNLPWRVLDNGTNIEMLLVPGGTFMMGCSPGDEECFENESPVHQVTLTNAFYMGKTEVTQAQWQATMGSNPSYYGGQSDSPSRPVEQVSWNMIQGFNTATSLRLPTEAEWEFACRAGTTTARYGELNAIAWYYQNWANYGTQPVAGKLPNAFGLYDTLGNVWEWCQDWYGPYSSASVTNPTGPATGTYRLLRGGSWGDYSYDSRGLRRGDLYPVTPGNVGFRAARNP
jgi:formylglycine-generating enzyme required for sulfatase activity